MQALVVEAMEAISQGRVACQQVEDLPGAWPWAACRSVANLWAQEPAWLANPWTA